MRFGFGRCNDAEVGFLSIKGEMGRPGRVQFMFFFRWHVVGSWLDGPGLQSLHACMIFVIQNIV